LCFGGMVVFGLKMGFCGERLDTWFLGLGVKKEHKCIRHKGLR